MQPNQTNYLSLNRFRKICFRFTEHRVSKLYRWGLIFRHNAADFNDDKFQEVIEETEVDIRMMSDEEQMMGLCFDDISDGDATIICRAWRKWWAEYSYRHNIEENCIVGV